jgi:hypothetical protein
MDMRLVTKTLTLVITFCILFAISSNAQQNDLKVQTNANSSLTQLYLYKAMLLSPTAMPAEQDEEEGILSNANIKIINLGPIVNFDGLDYAPTISADGRTLSSSLTAKAVRKMSSVITLTISGLLRKKTGSIQFLTLPSILILQPYTVNRE